MLQKTCLQAQKGGPPSDVWEAWEDYMDKEFSERENSEKEEKS